MPPVEVCASWHHDSTPAVAAEEVGPDGYGVVTGRAPYRTMPSRGLWGDHSPRTVDNPGGHTSRCADFRPLGAVSGGDSPHLRGRGGLSRAAAVGAYIGAAYWFTSSTSFANPAVTIGRMFSDTFAGIAPGSAPLFILMQLIGGAIGLAAVVLLYPDASRRAGDVVVPTSVNATL